MEEQKTQNAKNRWQTLKNFLMKSKNYQISSQDFIQDLFQKENIKINDQNYQQYTYINNNNQQQSIIIKQQVSEISIDELLNYNKQEVDSTGIKLWPAEEVMAYYCLKNENELKKLQDIIELGAGFSGLASLILAKQIDNLNITVTDGNENCIPIINENIIINNFQSKNIISKHLVWDVNYKSELKYDLVLLADCLFFKNFHDALIQTIYNLMKQESICIIIAPQRGDSQQIFLDKVQKTAKFKIKFLDFQDSNYQKCMDKHRQGSQYDENKSELQFIEISLIKS